MTQLLAKRNLQDAQLSALLRARPSYHLTDADDVNKQDQKEFRASHVSITDIASPIRLSHEFHCGLDKSIFGGGT